MDQHRWFVSAIAAAVLGGSSDTASGQPTSPPVITVLLYNYAGVSSDVLSAARDKVSVVFENAGVLILWAEPLSKAPIRGSALAECHRPFSIQVMIRARRAEWEPGRKRIKRVPKGTVCLLTALRFHGLGTQNPRDVWLAVDRSAGIPKIGVDPSMRRSA